MRLPLRPDCTSGHLFALASMARSSKRWRRSSGITDRLLTTGSDRRQLANTANRQTTAFAQNEQRVAVRVTWLLLGRSSHHVTSRNMAARDCFRTNAVTGRVVLNTRADTNAGRASGGGEDPIFATCGFLRDVRSPVGDEDGREVPRCVESGARRADTRNFRVRVCARLAAQTWIARQARLLSRCDGSRLRRRAAGTRDPRLAGATGPAGGDPLPKFAGLRIGPATAGGGFPAFMRTRYSGSAVSTTGGRTTGRALQVARCGAGPI